MTEETIGLSRVQILRDVFKNAILLPDLQDY